MNKNRTYLLLVFDPIRHRETSISVQRVRLSRRIELAVQSACIDQVNAY
jgi:hypothetical protein